MLPADIITKTVKALEVKKAKYLAKYNKAMSEIRARCEHKFKVLNTYNDHDGWSWVEITWYKDQECEICGLVENGVKTSTSIY